MYSVEFIYSINFTFILLIFFLFYSGLKKTAYTLTLLFLIYLSIPNFVSCGEGRSRNSSVRANAHTIQTMLETYAVDWKGQYPNNINNLKVEASKNVVNKYWKELKNPYTALIGSGNAYDNFDKKYFNEKAKEGCVYYESIFDKNRKVIKYYIYASGKDGFLIKDKDEKLFVLTNS